MNDADISVIGFNTCEKWMLPQIAAHNKQSSLESVV